MSRETSVSKFVRLADDLSAGGTYRIYLHIAPRSLLFMQLATQTVSLTDLSVSSVTPRTRGP